MLGNYLTTLNDKISQKVLSISEPISVTNNQCKITITLDWELAHALRTFLAPFLSQFCKNIDCRTSQEKKNAIEEKRRQEHERQSRIMLIKNYRAIYERGMSHEEWKKQFPYGKSSDYYKTRRRAIMLLKNKGLQPRYICKHFDISYTTYYAAAKSTHNDNIRIIPKRALHKLSWEQRRAYQQNKPLD